MKGTIKRLPPEEQYGFIKPDEGGKDVFFLFSWLKGVDPHEGLRVEFDVVSGEKGLRACNLKVLEQTTNKYRFHNPYNFVRCLEQGRPYKQVLGDCLPPPHDRYVGLTGRITCQVEAVTPLFISDAHGVEEENGHKTYRFFQYENQPARPAGSLRGMFRSVFEAVTNSCFAVLDEDYLSLRLESDQSPWLVPARVERDGDKWQLRLLPGSTNLQIKSQSPGKKNPAGKHYAAWCATYWPLKPSKTLLDIGPRGHKLSNAQVRTRKDFIKRTKQANWNPESVGHGEECYALLRPLHHPHPQIHFWDVVEIRRHRSSLSNPEGSARVEHGWLCITNQNIEPKHSERFFFRAQDNQSGPELIELPEEMRETYESLIKDYQKRHHKAVQKQRENNQPLGEPLNGKEGFSRFVYQGEERELKGGELVYAMIDGSESDPRVKFIAPVSVPRIVYEYSVGELLAGFLRRCKDPEKLCPACRMFGWILDSPPKHVDRVAYAGRVRFSHGILHETQGELSDTPLTVLSTPKPTTTSFYLLNLNGLPDAAVDYNTNGAKLRGRKFYRHQGKKLSEREYRRADNVQDEQNRTVRGALKPEAAFTFTVDFENLASQELGALLYALELEEGLFHRLGYAKPLGFGSVKVTVKKVESINWETRLKTIEQNSGWQPKDKAQYKKDFLQGMRECYGKKFDELLDELRALLGAPPDLPIHYPRPTNPFDAKKYPQYEWFVGNKKRIEKLGKGNLPEPVALGLATDDTCGLPLIKKKGEEG